MWRKSKDSRSLSMMQLQEYKHFRWIMCGCVGSGKQWIPGSITGKVGNVTFSVQLNDGRIRRSHQDNLRHQQKPDVPKVSISQDQTEVSPQVLPGVEEQPEEVVGRLHYKGLGLTGRGSSSPNYSCSTRVRRSTCVSRNS